MIQGRTNGELGNESWSWVGIGSKNRTRIWSLELLHKVVTTWQKDAEVILETENCRSVKYSLPYIYISHVTPVAV